MKPQRIKYEFMQICLSKGFLNEKHVKNGESGDKSTYSTSRTKNSLHRVRWRCVRRAFLLGLFIARGSEMVLERAEDMKKFVA